MAEQTAPEQAPDTVTVTINDGYLAFDPQRGEQVGGGSSITLSRADAERALRQGWATSSEAERPEPTLAPLSRRRQA